MNHRDTEGTEQRATEEKEHGGSHGNTLRLLFLLTGGLLFLLLCDLCASVVPTLPLILQELSLISTGTPSHSAMIRAWAVTPSSSFNDVNNPPGSGTPEPSASPRCRV